MQDETLSYQTDGIPYTSDPTPENLPDYRGQSYKSSQFQSFPKPLPNDLSALHGINYLFSEFVPSLKRQGIKIDALCSVKVKALSNGKFCVQCTVIEYLEDEPP